MWVELTTHDLQTIADLSATHAGPNYLAPVIDANGRAWLFADVLGEPLFAHYAPVLSRLTPSENSPTFAASSL